MIPRRRFHRTVFLLAGAYNIGWGIFSAVDPQWLFRFAGMQPSPYPDLRGAWPPATAVLCLTNDLVWWIPFGIYLVDAWPNFRREAVPSRTKT